MADPTALTPDVLRRPRRSIARGRLDYTRTIERHARRCRRLAERLADAEPDRQWALDMADGLDDLRRRMDLAHPRGHA